MFVASVHLEKLYVRAGPPTGLLFRPQMIYEYVELRWNDIGRGNSKKAEKTYLIATFIHFSFRFPTGT
jgi:hypothetical protein